MQEAQHRFFEEERSNRPRVELRVTGMSQENRNSPTGLIISAKNLGRRPADGFSWQVWIPSNRANMVSFANADWNKEHTEVAWLVVDGRTPFEPFTVLWSVHGEDGRVPTEGYLEIHVPYRAEGLLNVRPVD